MKLLKNYKPLYSITKTGKILSHRKHKYLKPQLSREGYLRVWLYKKRYDRKPFLIHVLMAQNYLDNYSSKLTVNHKDLNKLNNNYTNLEMMTNKENINHAIQLGVRKNYKLRLSGFDLMEIRKMCKLKNKYGKFNKYKMIAKKFNISTSVANKICRGVYN